MTRVLVLALMLQATFTSVGAVLVVLPVTVTNASGQRVIGLTQDSFRVYEDGRPQPVTVFHSGEGPVTLGLVVDHSGSMRDNLPGVTAAVRAFSSETHPDDELFVLGFNERVSRPLAAGGGESFTSDARALAAAIGAIPARGQTALYDAIIEGLQQLEQGRWDKRTLIVVSDGGDNASVHSYGHVQALARQSQAVIYAIGLRGASDEQAPGILRRLSRDTGGVAYFPRSSDEVSDVLTQIVLDLRQQYILGYVPEERSAAGSVRAIRVTVSAPGEGRLRVRTRTGYVVPEEDP